MPQIKGGYWGKIAWINLTTKKVSIKTFDNAFARKWLGGIGLSIKLIWDWVPRYSNPLGPRNLLVFATGAYQASTLPGSGRWTAAAHSPLTGYCGESNAGGHGGPRLKRAGFDAVAITGRAKKPVYIYLNNGNVEIKDATSYWGMTSTDTVEAIKKDLGNKNLSIAAIGPAGENLVRYANIANDSHGFFGRTGMGAVMGSKNLKALAIHGTLTPPIADKNGLSKLWEDEILPKVNAAPFTKENAEHGMAAAVVPREDNGLLPMKNWAQDTWKEGAKKIGAPRYTEVLKIQRWPCEYCIMGCHRRITAEGYPNRTGGPEYETLAMIGSNLLIDDLKAIVEANELCNLLGIDTIEVGAVLGWAFESYEKGYIKKEDTGGVELKWGSGEALIEMVKKIAYRRDIGDLLAEGLPACASKYPETKPWAVYNMNMGVAAHDPRAFFAEVVTTIASPRGSCHIHGFAEAIEVGATLPELGYDKQMDRFEVVGKGEVGAVYQDVQQFWNSLVWCFFYFFSNVALSDQVKLLNKITGWDVTPQEARKIGERIINLQHAFNLRMGLVPERDHRAPERMLIPHKEGGAPGKVPPYEYIIKEYYRTREWTEKGIPTRKKLLELGLEEAAKEIHGY
ncbi:MAG: aldehyde ferredoxin oxidoreductase family protein [Candidatus Njordarchaeales archaeon]